ncbi:MAG: hypothetical protein M5U18_18540 [Dehalococcoidia bacterium]|nr:hypothetical protein [Dehalococcoidia bacterium]
MPLEEGREFALHVVVVARVEKAFESIETDDGIDTDIAERGREGTCLVDDAGGISGEDGEFGPFAMEFEKHGDPVKEAGAKDILGDVPRGQHSGDVFDAINFERGFEQVHVRERGGIVGRGKESKASPERAARIEPRNRGSPGGVKFRKEVVQSGVGHVNDRSASQAEWRSRRMFQSTRQMSSGESHSLIIRRQRWVLALTLWVTRVQRDSGAVSTAWSRREAGS